MHIFYANVLHKNGESTRGVVAANDAESAKKKAEKFVKEYFEDYEAPQDIEIFSIGSRRGPIFADWAT